MEADMGAALAVWLPQGSSDAAELTRMLAELGYGRIPLFVYDNVEFSDPAHAAAVVVLMPGHESQWRQLEVQLNRLAPTSAVLGLAPLSFELRDPNLIDALSDLIQWPCEPAELGARLTRITRAPAPALRTRDELFLEYTLLGNAPRFRRAIDLIRKYAATDAPVLIEGESGTGKELAANALHLLGARAAGPCVAVNCGGVPETMIESEFFGHVRGAFTDAKADHPGYVEQAHLGTLFLDEVEALNEHAQVALLRFLESAEYRPIGAKSSKTADVRVIAASNVSLEELVEQGRFRADIYFRLNVLRIDLPPLRERARDVLLLADRFVARYARRYGKSCVGFDSMGQRQLMSYPWPGNARELDNFVHRAVVECEDDQVELRLRMDLSPRGESAASYVVPERLLSLPFAQAKAELLDEFERCYLDRYLDDAGGNVAKAARRAGKHRRAFDKLVEKHAIDKSAYRRS